MVVARTLAALVRPFGCSDSVGGGLRMTRLVCPDILPSSCWEMNDLYLIRKGLVPGGILLVD